jgi:hypothetical protein
MRSSPEIGSPKRRTIIWVLAAVLISYTGLFLHQLDHQLADDTHCELCMAADHFGHGLVANIPVIPTIQPQLPVAPRKSVQFVPAPLGFFHARAPPLRTLV